MRFLFEWLGRLIAGLFGRYFLVYTYRVLLFASFLVLLSASINSYISVAQNVLDGLSQTVPDVVQGVWQWVMPGNAVSIIVALISATMTRFFANLYREVFYKKFIIAAK